MRIAFYAPLKHPAHPLPSGDREMARLLIRALELAGHGVEIASSLRSHSNDPDAAALAELQARAASETERLTTLWRQDGRPDVWFTYHPYYRAPDFIGPSVARALGIAYATAEASHAGKRNRDAWRPWQSHVEAALQLSLVNFCFTAVDAEGLANHLGTRQRIRDLPPFIDGEPFKRVARPARRGRTVELITLAMMRPGAKAESYAFLAAALHQLVGLDWRLTIIGDGPARPEVEQAFRAFPAARLVWRGALAREDIPSLLAEADLYLWPGFGEAYGIAYLEAQAAGLPVVALDSGGVASTLQPGKTGYLVTENDLEAYVEAIRSLLDDGDLRRRMGRTARTFALEERSLARAASILDHGLAGSLQPQGSTDHGRLHA
ncbi:MAG: glycosyltransferase family 4 protein [Methylobacteriaceae bacterium]|nr:glycosyltransferase family 4 protein [Methylobacteriaceae bacterium]